ncbi:DUF6786 family protein [Luteolibacter sp. LG18]|uniref:DUF6786 family protein n=1 Tax=Luteolibacter sp. LG18 TaxID=2819286 RepID=UPI002B30DC29|nr:hypothetical protein llg_15300 [Luteolibacter sp. LG18]
MPFADDLRTLEDRTEIHVLKDPESGSKVAVAPVWQARVMTATWEGAEHGTGVVARLEGDSTRDFGGEEVPLLVAGGDAGVASFETGPFRVTAATDLLIQCEADGSLATPGKEPRPFRFERVIQILNKGEMARLLGIPMASTLKAVGYRSTHVIRSPDGQGWPESEMKVRHQGSLHCSPRALLVIPAPANSGFPPGNRWQPCGKALVRGFDGHLNEPIWPGKSADDLLCVHDPERNTLTLVMNGPRAGADPSPQDPVVPVPQEAGPLRNRTTIHLQGSAADLDAIVRNLLGCSLRDVAAAAKK